MAGNAFTAGVKPGGLTTSTEIRILLCYLIQHAGTPLSQGELETALLGEELVNYFELASNLSDLLEQGFVREENGRYTILPAGADKRWPTTCPAAYGTRPCAPLWPRSSLHAKRPSITLRSRPRPPERVTMCNAASAIWRATCSPSPFTFRIS